MSSSSSNSALHPLFFSLSFVLDPHTNTVSPTAEWKQFEVRPSTNKGGTRGVFVTTLVTKNTLIPFIGVETTLDVASKLSDKKHMMYVSKQRVINGSDAMIAQYNLPRGINIAAMINEPNASQGETANCEMRNSKDYYVVTRDIQQGEEVLVNYGNSYSRAGYSKKRASGDKNKKDEDDNEEDEEERDKSKEKEKETDSSSLTQKSKNIPSHIHSQQSSLSVDDVKQCTSALGNERAADTEKQRLEEKDEQSTGSRDESKRVDVLLSGLIKDIKLSPSTSA